jgi:hypothetical protein
VIRVPHKESQPILQTQQLSGSALRRGLKDELLNEGLIDKDDELSISTLRDWKRRAK